MAFIDFDVGLNPRNQSQSPLWADQTFDDLTTKTLIEDIGAVRNGSQAPLWADQTFDDLTTKTLIEDIGGERNQSQSPLWADQQFADYTNLTTWQTAIEEVGGPVLSISNTDPQPGSENVDINTSIVMPGGYWYTEPPTRLLLFRNIGALGGGATAGIDDSRTVIRVDLGSGYQTAYLGGATQGGWGGGSNPSGAGYIYEIFKSLPYASTVFVEITLYDFYGRRYKTVFSFSTESPPAGNPNIIHLNPAAGALDVPIDDYIEFETYSPLGIVENKTLIFINDVLVYENNTEQNGFTVQQASKITGFAYRVTPPEPFKYGSVIKVSVYAEDPEGKYVNRTYYLYAEESPTCFKGPVTAFEESILEPYSFAETKLYYTEQLRSLLVEAALHRPDPIKAIRLVFLHAHSIEISPVLRRVVPTPNESEKDVILCHRKTLIEMHEQLQLKPGLIEACIHELLGLGLPRKHVEMFKKYARLTQSNDIVPFSCALICLAKSLEVNGLV